MKPATHRALPAETIAHWHMLLERFHRSGASAFRHLVQDWRHGFTVPGLPPPAAPTAPLPRGLTYRTLMRYRPSPLQARYVGRALKTSPRA